MRLINKNVVYQIYKKYSHRYDGLSKAEIFIPPNSKISTCGLCGTVTGDVQDDMYVWHADTVMHDQTAFIEAYEVKLSITELKKDRFLSPF